MKKLLVFDWDGTLCDSLSRIVQCLQLSSEDMGLALPTEQAGREVIGLGLREALLALFPDLNVQTLEQLKSCYARNFQQLDRQPSEFYRGVEETLDVLRHRGFILAVATGKSRRGFDRVLRGHGLANFFDATRCADETASKPHPRMLLELMEELEIPPSGTMMVGDTEFDMEMAVRAGVPRVGVAYGAHSAERLRPYGLEACLTDFSDILKFI